MAATRKLQGEIDRCLKKVTEGVETFEDIWQKVHNATNSNQKEKYEADLKKEIKKLQRLRDQIKSWIASAEIKDKSSLLDNRRLIETQMERFKVVERETKTKAYSKEGLGAGQKLDPAQREKEEISNWLTNSINSLQIQVDQCECEIESLLAGKKKRIDKDKQDRIDEFRSKLERHKFHISKLETLLRKLDNDDVEVEQIRRIKDDVEYYIESSQEPDFEENEYLYDDIIGLDEPELSGTDDVLGPSSTTTDSNNSNETGGSPCGSITSGTSPGQSPILNCSNTINNSSESTSADYLDKKKQSDMIKVTPVKPTVLRVSKLDLNSSASSTSLIVAPSQAAQQQQQQQLPQLLQQQLPPPSKPIGTSTPSKSNHLPSQVTTTTTTSSSLSTPITTQTSSSTSLSLSSSLSLSVSAIIPPTAQFATIAKQHNTSHIENVASSLTYLTTTTANQSNTSLVSTTQSIPSNTILQNQSVSSSQQQQQHREHQQQQHQLQQQLQQQHQHLQQLQQTQQQQLINAASVPIAIGAHQQTAAAIHNSGVIGHPLSSSAPVPSDTTTVITNISITSSSNVTNTTPVVISSNSIASNRTSPGLVSPHQPPTIPHSQVLNGPTILNIKPSLNLSSTVIANNPSTESAEPMSTLKTIAQEAISRAGLDSVTSPTKSISDTRQQQLLQQQQQLFSVDSTTNNVTNGPNTNLNNLGNLKLTGTSEAHIPPLLSVAPLGTSPLQKEHQIQFQMMEAAFYHLPTPSDSERFRQYLHRQPIPTPHYYPQIQLPHSDTVEFFQRLSTETLFFVFYYMEGTKAQYLAAKALKKQSWRFHTKYMMWFQRHEEPRIINEEYEQGTYIYFDYEKWGQRKKEGFTFEYKYLEDRDLN